MKAAQYDWCVIGGGIAGLAVAEILSREGRSVLLIEKNEKLASETSKVFHEWVHSGALFTLVPDNLLTVRYLLGATDDLLQYYSAFPRMNLVPTESGVRFDHEGWFNGDRIEFRYRIRKLNPVWMGLVSRSISIIDLISRHDWLRRRAGSEYGGSKVKGGYWARHIGAQLKSREKFLSIGSPDFTMNSRVLMTDLLEAAIQNGLQVRTAEEVLRIRESGDRVEVLTNREMYVADNVAVCSPDLISKEFNGAIKYGYAPIAVVEGVPESEVSFVELDYNTKTCINLLKKEGGVGQAGGITVNKESEVQPYLDYVIKQHQSRNPQLKVIDSYVGIKKELVTKGEGRNYLYHINQHTNRIWSTVLGKFTLAFSMAPEFYRRVYKKNPTVRSVGQSLSTKNDMLSDTSWQEIVNLKSLEIPENYNGND